MKPGALYYGQKYRERCAAEMRDTTCREGMPVKLSPTGLKPNVRPHIETHTRRLEAGMLNEHTRCLVLKAYSNNLLLLHLDTFKKILSRPRNWEPADD